MSGAGIVRTGLRGSLRLQVDAREDLRELRSATRQIGKGKSLCDSWQDNQAAFILGKVWAIILTR